MIFSLYLRWMVGVSNGKSSEVGALTRLGLYSVIQKISGIRVGVLLLPFSH